MQVSLLNDLQCFRVYSPSGVWKDIAPVPSNSLVGLAPACVPGRGEAGARVGVPRAAGPKDWRAVALALSGPGLGLGLTEGGRRVLIEV